MKTRSISVLAAATVLLLLASSAGAQEGAPPPDLGWELSLYAGTYDDSPEFDLGRGAVSVDPDRNPLFGGRFGYTFSPGFFLQGEVGYVALQTEEARTGGSVVRQDTDVLLYGGALGYNLRLHDRFQLFAAVGGGAHRWSPDGSASETDYSLNYGGGARIFLTRSIALRGDVRMHQVPDAFSTAKARVGLPADETFWGWEFSGGLSFHLGGPSDSDGDGVRDERDACPETPAGVTVDERGCPVDSDADGVADYRDRCPDTPAGARVDERGCPTDGDGDGVYDGIDRCADTPQGATVDERGCPSDGDDDGVLDGIDRCPETPAGVRVDERGCPVDSDGDGVPDGPDQCPNTSPGTEVDEEGCPVSEIQRQLEEEREYAFGGVNFEFNSAQLRESAAPTLREVGRVLVQNEGIQVEIQGHTDSIGPADYNETLGRRRAESVLEFLLRNFPSLSRDQFTVRSFGETEPVATNETESGRQQNRRVEIEVVEPSGG